MWRTLTVGIRYAVMRGHVRCKLLLQLKGQVALATRVLVHPDMIQQMFLERRWRWKLLAAVRALRRLDIVVAMLGKVTSELRLLTLLALPAAEAAVETRWRHHHTRLIPARYVVPGRLDTLDQNVIRRWRVAVRITEMFAESVNTTRARLASLAVEVENVVGRMAANERRYGRHVVWRQTVRLCVHSRSGCP